MRHRLLLLTTALAALPAFADAQPAADLDAVVVTASRLGGAAGRPYAPAILPASTIAGQPSLAGALDSLADIHVQTPGGRSGAASIFLRGADPNFTAVLLDGVALNNSTNSRGGAVNASEISASNLDRIEIVNGPLSGLYGSGALAGAINLVVPGGAAAHEVQATGGFGSRGWRAASALWRGPLSSGLGGSLGLTADDDGEQTPGSMFKSASVTGKLAPLGEEDAGRLVFRLSKTEVETYPDASGGPRLAASPALESRDGRERLLGLSAPVYRSGALRLDLSATYLHRRDQTVTPGVAPSAIDPVGLPGGEDNSRYERASAQAAGRFEQDGWSLLAGVEAVRERGSSEGFLDFGFFQAPASFDEKRTTVSGFAEAVHAAGALVLNGGARVDDVEGLGSRLTARAGARYEIGGGWSVRAMAGSGFKAPSFYALGNPFVGNRNLDPERSLGGELGLNWQGEGANSLAVAVFRTRYKGLIDFDPGPPPSLQNRDVVDSEGVSAGLTRALTSDITAGVQALYAKTTDQATGDQLLNRPRWRLTASLAWAPSDSLSLAVRAVHVGKRDDYATPVGVQTLGAYQTLALEGSWRLLPQTTARLVIENATDQRFESAVGFRSPGASARLYLTQRF